MLEKYEQYIAKLNRRIAKIEASPDPSKIFATKLRYEIERDQLLEQIAAYRNGTPIGYSICGMGSSIFPAMGATYVHPSVWCDAMFAPEGQEWIEEVRACGYPDRACERTVIPIVACKRGQMVPPSFGLATQDSCDWLSQEVLAITREFDVPFAAIDVPPTHGERDIDYVAQQLKDACRYLADEVPGLKRLTVENLVYWQRIVEEIFAYQKDSLLQLANVPSPLPNREAFRLVFVDRWTRDPQQVLEFFRRARHEAMELVRKGVAGVPGEKARVMVAPSMPFYSNFASWLQEKKVALVMLYNGGIPGTVGTAMAAWDDPPYDWSLDPFEREAKRQLMMSWGSFGSKWVRDGIGLCKRFKLDGIIYMQQTGCKPSLGPWIQLVDAAREELGIPTLTFEGRMMVTEGHNEEEFRKVMDEWIDEVLLPSKEERMKAAR